MEKTAKASIKFSLRVSVLRPGSSSACRICLLHLACSFALSSVTSKSAAHPREVYTFLKDSGIAFIQFIPVVERVPNEQSRQLGLELAEPRPGTSAEPTEVMPWSVGPEQYGDFLIAIFEEWVKRDVGIVFVQLFDICLAAWIGQEPPLCNFAHTCGNAMIIEHNGDLYSCDHFVYPDHRLGNILEDPVEEMVGSDCVRRLDRFKEEGLPAQCRDCEMLFACHGGCRKNRFATTGEGETGLNYLCPGYHKFFRHIDPKMKKMAELLGQQRAPAEIMDEGASSRKRPGRIAVPGMRGVGRNEPCPCGSGRKYKRCCGSR